MHSTKKYQSLNSNGKCELIPELQVMRGSKASRVVLLPGADPIKQILLLLFRCNIDYPVLKKIFFYTLGIRVLDWVTQYLMMLLCSAYRCGFKSQLRYSSQPKTPFDSHLKLYFKELILKKTNRSFNLK